MAIQIRNQLLEQQVRSEAKARGHKTLAKTIVALAEERLTELRMNQFVPPPARRTKREPRVA